MTFIFSSVVYKAGLGHGFVAETPDWADEVVGKRQEAVVELKRRAKWWFSSLRKRFGPSGFAGFHFNRDNLWTQRNDTIDFGIGLGLLAHPTEQFWVFVVWGWER